MKVLITSCPNDGHLFPTTPPALAPRDAGHTRSAAVAELMAAAVTTVAGARAGAGRRGY